ncbi:Uu.00g093000.m01.CDS01 [Anthostomella pinea]|uniref:ubiquitinyl hydrolase 1 n=1 Tax=Anthostomella pinea TaxID=933095 RepID=A0AAI8YI47_9PEZI|nr:Uu.00g093000.m01.CDS01 [Anthostomella pinea]
MSYDSDIHSPNHMMVDSQDEMVVQPTQDGNDPVAIIEPDQLDNDADPLENQPLATDFEAMKEIVLPPLLEEPRILEDVVDTWTVEKWRSLPKKEHGPVFYAGGFPWRILLFPFGNNVDQSSVYLEHGFEDANSIPDDWSCCVQFGLVMWNRTDPSLFCHHTAHHRFTKEESDWGFTRFLELRKMFQPSWENSDRPLVENESCNITAYVRIVEDETGVMWHNFQNYDSKKETGYVGLKNQGATCYLNSLLQSLYFTNAFRKAVYQIPTAEDESVNNSAYTLQRLFYQLQISNLAVGTNELTRSFGWDSRHVFEQQDVQELSRKLIERMEERMKGTAAEDALPRMLSGKVKTYVSCIDVDYESSRIEDFWDIQLNVRGIPNLQESFKDYIQQETLDGDNKYWAGDDHKYQDARKGVIFTSFPEVLHLHLKRFEYDIQHDTMMKINDRFEFPETLDLEPFLEKGADNSEPWTYKLHGVLVHQGDLNAGHYYAFLKPSKDGWFYKFDDDKVTKATMRETLEENFGGEYKSSLMQSRSAFSKKPLMRQMNAYMLVYIRSSRLNQVLTEVDQDDCPEHLQKRLDDEAAAKEAKRKEREEQHLFLPVKVITEQTFKHHASTDLTNFDTNPAEDPAAARFYKMKKQATMAELVETVAKDLNQEPREVRLWIMVNRQNKTTRPDQPIMDLRPTIEETYSRSAGTSRDYALRVWAEVADETDEQGNAVWPTYTSNANGVVIKNDLILLFLKYFDIEQQTLEGVGHLYVSKEKKVEELVPIISKKMGWGDKLPAGEQLAMWEEIKPSMIEGLKAKQTLKAAELQDGDIICFQKLPERKSSGEILGKTLRLGDKNSEESLKRWDRFDDAKAFYDFLCHKRQIRFEPHPRSDKVDMEGFELVLSTKATYDQLSERVGEHLKVDPTHIRFFTANASTGAPKAPVRRAGNPTLGQILNPSSYTSQNPQTKSNALFFEVLDMSLAELDTKKSVKVTWLSEGITKEDTFDVLVNKQGHIEDLIEAFAKKAGIKDEREGGRIRIYEIHNHKFFRELVPNYPVLSINDYADVIAERVPEEELGADGRNFIKVIHFQSDPARAHGIPFKFLLKEGEPFSETKKRLEKRTGIKGKAFEKIRFAILRRYDKPSYLTDESVLFEEGGNLEEEASLGLDHLDRTRTTRNGGEMFLK